jgi:N-succinyldiaminopimelate aminotransferase
MFSMTGWKVGWAVATEPLAAAVANAHLFLTFTTAPNLQSGIAYGLGKDPGHFDRVRRLFEQARDFLIAGLGEVGLIAMPAQGSYFICVDLAASAIAMDDMPFCERAVTEAGVAAIPLSSFYDANPPRHMIRLCFAKQRETLEAGIAGLALAKRTLA